MSDPKPNPAASRPGHGGQGSRYLFLFLLGLVVGAVATVMLVRAWSARQDPFPESVMHVQQWHVGQLRDNVQANRCGATDTLPHLQALRILANDIQPAFPDLRDDQRFSEHASRLRGAIDAALASPPLQCEGVTAAVQQIGEACKACHQDFR